MCDELVSVPITGVLSSTTTAEDLEHARRRAAYAHLGLACKLWPSYFDLAMWLHVIALDGELVVEESDA